MTDRGGRAGAHADTAIAGLSATIVAQASRLGYRIAVAESLTGGLLAAALVAIPGASRAFSGGIVAYDTGLKHALLGVDAGLLQERGPVDAAVAEQMAAGARLACAVPGETGEKRPADIGVATTGVAGPDPDPQTGQPAGTVWIGVSTSDATRSRLLRLAGTRDEIRAEAVAAALEDLLADLERRAIETEIVGTDIAETDIPG